MSSASPYEKDRDANPEDCNCNKMAGVIATRCFATWQSLVMLSGCIRTCCTSWDLDGATANPLARAMLSLHSKHIEHAIHGGAETIKRYYEKHMQAEMRSRSGSRRIASTVPKLHPEPTKNGRRHSPLELTICSTAIGVFRLRVLLGPPRCRNFLTCCQPPSQPPHLAQGWLAQHVPLRYTDCGDVETHERTIVDASPALLTVSNHGGARVAQRLALLYTVFGT